MLNTTIEPLLVYNEDSGGAPDAGAGGLGRGPAVAERLCHVIGGRHLLGALVVGGGHVGLTATLAAVTAGLPVLWARDGSPPPYSLTNQVRQLIRHCQKAAPACRTRGFFSSPSRV